MNTNGEFGWNDEIEKESQFQLLPAGKYPFRVTGFDRARHPGSPKLPPCNKAVLKLEVQGNPIKHNLFLHSKCEWMLSSFFICIGLKKPGEKLRMDWGKVMGATGMCELKIHEWKSNNTGEPLQSNEVKKFLPPTNKPAQSSYTVNKPMQPAQPAYVYNPDDNDEDLPF